ncbi:hypothetical protein XF35_24750 [Streptomyces platensis subsp. clarensis]|nr:hypothetical protein [Streptomyces platensis subsp. clarensis]
MCVPVVLGCRTSTAECRFSQVPQRYDKGLLVDQRMVGLHQEPALAFRLRQNHGTHRRRIEWAEPGKFQTLGPACVTEFCDRFRQFLEAA